jgi:glutamate-1-semialdehyde aminotransferase
MKKTVKKLDNHVVKALTNACERLKEDISDFTWLTHTADYANFPGSLMVRCVFNTESALANMHAQRQDTLFVKSIHAELLKVGVLLKTPKRHVVFDSEEACLRDNGGNWKQRLNHAH